MCRLLQLLRADRTLLRKNKGCLKFTADACEAIFLWVIKQMRDQIRICLSLLPPSSPCQCELAVATVLTYMSDKNEGIRQHSSAI